MTLHEFIFSFGCPALLYTVYWIFRYGLMDVLTLPFKVVDMPIVLKVIYYPYIVTAIYAFIYIILKYFVFP